MNALSIVSLAVTLVLFLAAIFLGVQNRAETVRNRERIETLQKQLDSRSSGTTTGGGPSIEEQLLAAQGAGAAQVAPNAQLAAQAMMEERDREIEDLKAQLEAQSAENATLDEQYEKMQADAQPALTDIQRKIGSMPAIAKVLEVVDEGGFVVLDAGSNRRLESGGEFYVRRGNYIIGKLTIGDTVEEVQCVADIDMGTVPAGYQVQVGDDVIQFWQ